MKQANSRTENIIRNTVWAITTQMAVVLLGIINRKVFLDHLGIEYLGVNSLFSDVLILFSFVDLGFGTAIMFSLYKPIALNDDNKVLALLKFYRNIYRYVIFTLIIISVGFIPFLGSLKTSIPQRELIVYYFFFQLSNIAEYLWAYRENYVIACQKEREITIITLIYNILKNVSQILILALFENFVVYLFVGVCSVVTKKIVTNIYITNRYPITLLKGAQSLDYDEKKSIINKTIALAITKVGNLIINQTDSLIVSYIISVAQWGLASNYLLIKRAVFNISDKVYSAILPSMGNLIVDGNIEKETKAFLKYDFLNAWIHTFFFIALTCMSSAFIELFFGQGTTLPSIFVFIFFFASFVDGLRSPVSVMREATGTFEKDKWYTLLAAVINLIVSLPLAHVLGLIGVYIGTISSMIVLHVARSFVLLKNGDYLISTKGYIFRIIKHVFVGVAMLVITNLFILCANNITSNLYISFFIKGVIVCVVPNIFWLLLYRKNNDYISVRDSLINRIFNK